MQGSKNSIDCIADNFLGPSNTCTGKIARILFIVAACSFACAFSSTIASTGIYLLDSGLRAECSAKALSSLVISASVVAVVSFVSAVGMGKGLCGNYDVCSSSTSSEPPSDIIIVQSPHAVSSGSSSLQNAIFSISPPHSINPSDLSSESASFQYYPPTKSK